MSIITKIVENGLLKELNGTELKVFLLIWEVTKEDAALVIDDDTIADALNLSIHTVKKTLNTLCSIELDGRNLIYKVNKGTYTVNQVEVPLEFEYKLTAVLSLFRAKYFEVYGVEPNIVFPVELSKLKNLAIREKYSWEQIQTIVAIGVGEYKDRWANSKFPRPQIGAVFGWLAPKCLEIYADNIDKEYDDSCNQDMRLF